jgi:hypothetical protein
VEAEAMVGKIPLSEWEVLELAVEVNETPVHVGVTLFNLLVKAGYTHQEVRNIASAVFRLAEDPE